MRVFIAVIGSGGDLHPMLGVATELARRGHDVTVLAGSWQEQAVRRSGLRFSALLTGEQFRQFRDAMRSGGEDGAEWMAFFHYAVLPAVEPVFAHVTDRIRAERLARHDTLLIGSSHAIGLRLLAERFGLPLVTTRLQPQPRLARADDAGRATFNRLMARIVDRQRSHVGLAPLERPFDEWLVCLDRAIAFFPEWFLDLRVDAEEQGRMFDFVLFDPQSAQGIGRGLDLFLARYESPLVFTHGTGNDGARAFFDAACEACLELERPAVFLTQHAEQLSRSLPRQIIAADYVPFESLLPHAAAIVHHGGIGTCAQALKAALPQLVVPVGFDQHQNARRVEYLGAGKRMTLPECSAPRLARGFGELLEAASIGARCRDLARQFRPENTIERCCDLILEGAPP